MTPTSTPASRAPGPAIAWARQSLPLIINHGRLSPKLNDSTAWGYTLGNAVRVWRTGVGIDRRGNIIYAAANHGVAGRPNYDLYWMRIDPKEKSANTSPRNDFRRGLISSTTLLSPFSARSRAIPYRFRTADNKPAKDAWLPKPVRITYAPGADVLPVFSPDGKKIMWTSTRDGRRPAQLYIADFTPPKD